jgi:hypothetical protein
MAFLVLSLFSTRLPALGFLGAGAGRIRFEITVVSSWFVHSKNVSTLTFCAHPQPCQQKNECTQVYWGAPVAWVHGAGLEPGMAANMASQGISPCERKADNGHGGVSRLFPASRDLLGMTVLPAASLWLTPAPSGLARAASRALLARVAVHSALCPSHSAFDLVPPPFFLSQI